MITFFVAIYGYVFLTYLIPIILSLQIRRKNAWSAQGKQLNYYSNDYLRKKIYSFIRSISTYLVWLDAKMSSTDTPQWFIFPRILWNNFVLWKNMKICFPPFFFFLELSRME